MTQTADLSMKARDLNKIDSPHTKYGDIYPVTLAKQVLEPALSSLDIALGQQTEKAIRRLQEF
uniref:Uncharacterized protein n=1 Tax=Melanopsichium pennsylvanicum 4 TaxID=1398559 RepID=A0A077R2G7_9BASI|nr:uncharacterized protein BN887_06014 [Melanopsichium pennsylvanicum 4]